MPSRVVDRGTVLSAVWSRCPLAASKASLAQEDQLAHPSVGCRLCD